jgi:hypothetical protein
MSDNLFEKGLLFDEKLNYFSYSHSRDYHGFIRSVEDNIMYNGGLRDKMPSGFGYITVNGSVVLLGKFNKGIPKGICYYFNKRGELNFIGSYYSTPVFGVFGKNGRYYEGTFDVSMPTNREVNFVKNPITLSNLRECKKIHDAFADFVVNGVCNHYDDNIYQFQGRIQYEAKEHSGHLEVTYRNGSKYIGEIFNSSRSGLGYLVTNGGKFKIFGTFKGGNEVRGYFLIDPMSENSLKETSLGLLIPRMIYGDILYDLDGKVWIRGQVKAILSNGSVYYGQFLNNSLTGYGKLYKNDELRTVYTGQIYYGKQCGVGQLDTINYTYEGEFHNDKFQGLGKYSDENIILKGFWQESLCLYGSIEFKERRNRINFNLMYILFDTPTFDFSFNRMKGYVEVFFDSHTIHSLGEVYSSINISEQAETKEVRVLERRGSMFGGSATKFEHIVDLVRKVYKDDMAEAKGKSSHSQPKQLVHKSLMKLIGRTGSSDNVGKEPSGYAGLPFRPSPGSKEAGASLSPRHSPSSPRKIGTISSTNLKSSPIPSAGRLNPRHFTIRSKFNRQTSLAEQYPTMEELEERLVRVYTFVGRYSCEEGGLFTGMVKKFEEPFLVVQLDRGFHRGLGYLKSTEGYKEIYGEMRDFRVSGLASSTWRNSRMLGHFEHSLPDGLVVKIVNNKESYTGHYQRGQKHGEGFKKVDREAKHVHLLGYFRGELKSIAKIEGG